MTVAVINFAQPLSEAQRMQVEALAGQQVAQVLGMQVYIDMKGRSEIYGYSTIG